MKHYVQFLSCLLLFSAATLVYAEDAMDASSDCVCQKCGSAVFIPRPQGLNSAVLYDPFYYACCDKSIDSSWTFGVGYRYEQVWNAKRQAQCLFGGDVINFAGTFASKAASTNYLLAENFGLSPDFLGSIAFDPLIQNNIIDFAARYECGSLSDCLDKLYIGINASLVNSNWDLRACEINNNDVRPDKLQLPQCLDGTVGEPALGDIKTALSGTRYFGQLAAAPMRHGSFVFDRGQSTTRLANIDLLIGYDFMRYNGFHFGLFVKTVAPTGNRPDPKTVFAPIIGNAHHWELGGGLDTHWDIWSCDQQCLTAWFTGSITHLFNDTQCRTFDLKEGCCMSRYQLLKVFAKNDAGVLNYDNKLMFGTDFTTRRVNTSFDVQGDATLKILYRNCGWAFGFGYNVYGRSKETIKRLDESCNVDRLIVANKGATGVCAINNADATITVPLNSTQEGFCLISNDTTVPQSVDNPVPGGIPGYKTWDGDGTIPAPNSDPAVPMSVNDIAFKGVPRQLSQKVFGHVDYQWEDCKNKPFFGFGGECEFAQDAECDVCTANQWGMWVHGGLSF